MQGSFEGDTGTFCGRGEGSGHSLQHALPWGPWGIIILRAIGGPKALDNRTLWTARQGAFRTLTQLPMPQGVGHWESLGEKRGCVTFKYSLP